MYCTDGWRVWQHMHQADQVLSCCAASSLISTVCFSCFCRVIGFKFERIGPPQPAEMASIAAERVIETLRDVDKGVVPWFKDAAKTWLDEVGNPEEALALALAKITGGGHHRECNSCCSIWHGAGMKLRYS